MPKLMPLESMILSFRGMRRDQMNSQGKMAKKKSQAEDQPEKKTERVSIRERQTQAGPEQGIHTAEYHAHGLNLNVPFPRRPQGIPARLPGGGLIPQHD